MLGKQLDILFVITSLQVGGSERQLALLATALAREGRSIAVYSFVDGPVREVLERAGIEVAAGTGLGATNVAAAAWQLFRFMRHRRPRVAHFILPAAYLVGAPLAWMARVPVCVMSRRSLNVYQRKMIVRVLERLYHRRMHAVIGNSRGVVAQLRDEGIAAERLALIYNGLDDGAFARARPRAETRAALGLAPDALVLSIVANLIPYKGHSDLIETLGHAADRMPTGWRLLVIGRDDGIGGDLKVQVERLGLTENVVFLGARPDVAELLVASDIGLLPSHEEGFSNAILESMAAGLPLVVTDVGGNAEAVIDGETGFVVPPHDSSSLTAALIRLAVDPGLRAQLGAAGRQRVIETFSVDRYIGGHRALYDALHAGRRPADVTAIAAP